MCSFCHTLGGTLSINYVTRDFANSARALCARVLRAELSALAGRRVNGCLVATFQGFAAQDTTLGSCILGLLDTEPHIETGTLPLVDRFRGTLRLMFNPETR